MIGKRHLLTCDGPEAWSSTTYLSCFAHPAKGPSPGEAEALVP